MLKAVTPSNGGGGPTVISAGLTPNRYSYASGAYTLSDGNITQLATDTVAQIGQTTTAAQVFQVYNTSNSATNPTIYERLAIVMQGTGRMLIVEQNAGGGSPRGVTLQAATGGNVQLSTGGTIGFTSSASSNTLHLVTNPATTGAVDLGSSAAVYKQIWSSVYSTSVPNTQTGATYAVATTDSYIIANRAGTMTLTLPAAASFPGRRLVVKTITANTVVSDASNVVPQAGGAAGTAILAATAGKYAELISNGTNWEIFAAN